MIQSALEFARTASGLANAMQPEDDVIVRRGLRIAGTRHVLQAALTLAAPEFRLPGAAVDALHAASMLVVAATLRRYRRPALAQAALAAAFAAAEVWAFTRTDAGAKRGRRR